MAQPPTTEEYLRAIDARLRNVKGLTKEVAKVVMNIHTEHTAGIFQDGLDGTSYSSSPTLAGSNVFGNRNKFGRDNYTFATKSGSDKFFGSKTKIKDADWRRVGTGNDARNLILIQGGYKAIRQADGRQTKKVDLSHTGLLQRDFASSLTQTQAGWVSGVRQDDNVGKLAGAVKRYGDKLKVPQKVLSKFAPKLGAIMVKFLDVA